MLLFFLTQNPLVLCQEEEQRTKPGELEPSINMREGEKSKTGPQMNNGSVARFVAMDGRNREETKRNLTARQEKEGSIRPTYDEAMRRSRLVPCH